ncbi:MAG: hypothetical protein LBR53_01365 [Deltaproteobacteria bacterium]|jgi:hypothetical protein|nr:hypothetical protein [Deltaproteobacteria bacterium]
MRKTALLFFLSLCLSLSLGARTAFAQNDYVPTACANIKDPSQLRICETAKALKTPIYATSNVIFFLTAEKTIAACSFKTTKAFSDMKNQIHSNPKISYIYDAVKTSDKFEFKTPTSEECGGLRDMYKSIKFEDNPIIE